MAAIVIPVRHMVTDGAARRRAQQGVVTSHMTSNAANHRPFKAPSRLGRTANARQGDRHHHRNCLAHRRLLKP